MPLNRLIEKTQAEQDLENLVKGRPAASAQEIASTGDVVSGSRGRFAQGLAERFGQEGITSARPFINDLQRENDLALELRSIRERRDSATQKFNFLSDRLANAGIDRSKAEEVAMQFALDEQNQANTSATNQKARDLAAKKQDILDEYAVKQQQLAQNAADERRKNAFKNAIYQTLFGLAGVGIGAGIVSRMGSNKAGTAAGGFTGNIVGSGETLTEKSSFIPRRPFIPRRQYVR